MLGNCEKMVVISSTATNDWPQNHQIDDQNNKGLLMASTGGNSNRVMEKPASHQDHHQAALKCPRCDSSNTKFCYYNNYSLSQPRHFCKACKRYWTRGGTLRNVPVGGGCRKNKRLKRPPPPSSSSAVDAPSPAFTAPPPSRSQIDLSAATASSNHVAPLFYGLPTTASELSLPFPRFNSRASNEDTVSGYDLGLGFSSSGMIMAANDGPALNQAKHIQDLVTSSSFLSGYSVFGSSCTSSASLINSGLQQQSVNKFVHHDQIKDQSRGGNHFQNLLAPYDQDLQLSAAAAGGNTSMATKQVKSELQAHNSTALEWMNSVVPCQNQIEQIGSSDPSLYWNLTSLGAGAGPGWPDLPNMGSSVTSLI